jgi:tetratricopeptide (TPR) repeat protein
MKQILEERVPYDHSVLWQVHDAYFATRGLDAWTGGDIPYVSTSNFAAARQHARLFEALVAELEARGAVAPGAPLPVLEIGSGLGELASNFLRALPEELAARVRYVFSDYQASTVQAAVSASEDLRERAERGQIIPATFDMRRPEQLRGLDGKEIELPLVAVLVTYVMCVAPIKVIKKDGETYSEVLCTVSSLDDLETTLLRATRPGVLRALDVEYEWRDAPLADILTDPFHQKVVEHIGRQYPKAVLRYPYVFFDVLRALRPRLADGAMVLISDYGVSDAGMMKMIDWRGPDIFGNSIAHGVDFGLFEHFCATLGVSMGRTHGALRSVQTAALRFGQMAPSFAEAFARTEQASDSDDLIDLVASARLFVSGPHANPLRAVRLLQRCLELDPYSAPLHQEIGDACMEAGFFEMGEKHFRRCAELDTRGEHDIQFELGRMYARTGRPREALEHYLRSLERDVNPATLANIGLAHMELGDLDASRRALEQALRMAPDYERAQKLMEELAKASSART